MNTPITITLYDLLIALLIIAGISVMVLLIICLIRIIKMLGKFNDFIDKTSKPVSDSIAFLPEIVENVSITSKNVAEITESAGALVDGVGDVFGSSDSNDGSIFSKISFITNLVQSVVTVIKNLFSKD